MKRSLLALPLLALLSTSAFAADGVSWNYVEGGYSATNTDAGDADGFALGGSAAIHPNFHLFGSYANQELEDTNIDFDQWRLGAIWWL